MLFYKCLGAYVILYKRKTPFGVFIWCAGEDSNLRSPKAADLQSARFDHLPTDAINTSIPAYFDFSSRESVTSRHGAYLTSLSEAVRLHYQNQCL